LEWTDHDQPAMAMTSRACSCATVPSPPICRRLISLGVAVALVALSASSASAQHKQRLFDAPRSFTIAEENDAFGDGGTDNDYTQGLRLGYDFAVWSKQLNWAFRPLSLIALGGSRLPAIRRACTADTVAQDEPCGQFALSVGQTEYTPTDLVTTSLVRDERPYAGYLWFGLARTALFPRVQVTSEIDVGWVGRYALARETQSLAHWTWASNRPQPQGWDNQLHGMLHLSLINQYAYRLLQKCGNRGRLCSGGYAEARWFDLAPHATLTAGTLMTRASGGATLRLGMRMPETLMRQNIVVSRTAVAPAEQRQPSPSWWKRHRPWFMGIATGDLSVVGHNALLSGSKWADEDPGEWRAQRLIATKHGFGELSYGAGLGMSEATLVFQRVIRGAEYEPLPGTSARAAKHHYGTITISIHQPAR
jgi:lipid A 3-O-deacylase